MREPLRFAGGIVSASISRIANRWYASITVDIADPIPPLAENQGSVGVDLGVTRLATLSTGEIFFGTKSATQLAESPAAIVAQRVTEGQGFTQPCQRLTLCMSA